MILPLFALLMGLWTDPAAAQVAVIAHRSVPADGIERGQLLDFYTGDARAWGREIAKQRRDVQPVVAVDLATRSEVREAFYRYLGKTSSRMRSIWLKRKLAGEGDPPLAMQTEEALVARVGSTPGAIGFVSQSKVTGSVKILAVIPLEDD